MSAERTPNEPPNTRQQWHPLLWLQDRDLAERLASESTAHLPPPDWDKVEAIASEAWGQVEHNDQTEGQAIQGEIWL